MSLFLTPRQIFLCCFFVTALAAPAHAAPVKNKTFGDWTLVCTKKDKTKQKQCEIAQTQTVKDKKGKQQGRLLRLGIAKKGKNKFMLHALLPLGLSLQSGVAVVIDDNKKQKNMVLQRCTSLGCEATMIFGAKFISKLKKGKKLNVGFKVADKTMIIPASLKGISLALRKIR